MYYRLKDLQLRVKNPPPRVKNIQPLESNYLMEMIGDWFGLSFFRRIELREVHKKFNLSSHPLNYHLEATNVHPECYLKLSKEDSDVIEQLYPIKYDST